MSRDVEIGNAVRLLREGAGLSQTAFAKVTGIGHQQTITKIETGDRKLSADELLALSEMFEVALDWWLGPGIDSVAPLHVRATAVLDNIDSQIREWRKGELQDNGDMAGGHTP